MNNDERCGDNEFLDDRLVLDNPQFHDSPQCGLVTLELDRSLHLVNKYPDLHSFAPGIPNPREYCGVMPKHLSTEFGGDLLFSFLLNASFGSRTSNGDRMRAEGLSQLGHCALPCGQVIG
jgi:hypothetical protein